VADLVGDVDLLRQARREAFRIVEQDPHLNHPQHQYLKEVLETSYGYRMELAEVG
jgi:hypothetical protein